MRIILAVAIVTMLNMDCPIAVESNALTSGGQHSIIPLSFVTTIVMGSAVGETRRSVEAAVSGLGCAVYRRAACTTSSHPASTLMALFTSFSNTPNSRAFMYADY